MRLVRMSLLAALLSSPVMAVPAAQEPPAAPAATACGQIETALQIIENVKAQEGGEHRVISGAVAHRFLELLNAEPPETSYEADTILLYDHPAGATFVFLARGTQVCETIKVPTGLAKKWLAEASRGA